MNKRFNFEDNIFIILMRLRMIRDIIILDPEPDLFLEKILDDIYFTDHILRILLEYIQENDRLIARDEFLNQLFKTEGQFYQLTRDFLDREGNISVREIPPVNEKLLALRDSSMERHKTLEELCHKAGIGHENTTVSSDEINELLKAF